MANAKNTAAVPRSFASPANKEVVQKKVFYRSMKANTALAKQELGSLVIEWAVEHKQDLLNDWKLAEQHQPLNKIEPLE